MRVAFNQQEILYIRNVTEAKKMRSMSGSCQEAFRTKIYISRTLDNRSRALFPQENVVLENRIYSAFWQMFFLTYDPC
jgi:hypothetical protein